MRKAGPAAAVILAAIVSASIIGCGGMSASAAASPSTSTVSTALGPETIFASVQQMPGWQTCGNCGNSGATGGTASYTMTEGIAQPSEDGGSAQFSLDPGAGFENGYWYIKHQLPSDEIKKLTYTFDLYVPNSAAAAPQAIEFECQQRLGGWIYNFAWQANYAGGTWRIFNYVMRRWEDSGIPLAEFAPGQWHHIVAEFHADASTKKVFHDALTIDGNRHTVNRSHDAKNTGGASDYFSNAFQLDSNSRGQSYDVFVDEMKVTVDQ